VLEEIRIVDLGVIAQATVPIGPGLTVLTGETGAGKTMILSALALLLGGRADPGLVRPGAARAVVEGRWRLPPEHPAVQAALGAGAALDDDGTLVVVRVLSGGKSRAVLGGAGVPAAVLTGFADDLVAVHGQAEQQRLARPALQRELIDRYGGASLSAAAAAYDRAFAELAATLTELAEVTGRAQERVLEADGLRHGLTAVQALAPVPGEEADTAALVARLGNAEALALASQEAYARLADGDGLDARTQLVTAAHTVRGAADLDPGLAELAARLEELGVLITDVASDLASYADGLVVDPAALAAAQERTAALTALTRRYTPGGDATELDAWARRAEARLAALDGDADRRAELAVRAAALAATRDRCAAALTAARVAAADRLTAAAARELAALAMPGAGLRAEITPAAPGPTGADAMTLLLRAHPGAPERPLGRAASGGELSRLMLALEVALADADPVPTMVFDEVDAGVGGAAAVEVGRRLAALGDGHQVLVVTHLPQVAAFADHHVRVVKDATGDVTTSNVTVLGVKERRSELARMLGGLEHSGAALDHAGELLELAARP
jgi:DNA repair protein RecN (Recombination protein N)